MKPIFIFVPYPFTRTGENSMPMCFKKNLVVAIIMSAFASSSFAALVTVGNMTAQNILDNTSISSISSPAPSGFVGAGSLTVTVAASHTLVGDLIYTLTHGGTSVILMDRPGVPLDSFGNETNLSSDHP